MRLATSWCLVNPRDRTVDPRTHAGVKLIDCRHLCTAVSQQLLASCNSMQCNTMLMPSHRHAKDKEAPDSLQKGACMQGAYA